MKNRMLISVYYGNSNRMSQTNYVGFPPTNHILHHSYVVCYLNTSFISFIFQDELLLVSLDAVSATLLNLTVINCHRHSASLTNVHSSSKIIISLIQKLLYRVEYDHGFCLRSLTLPHPSLLSEENMLAFTCKNLSMAESLFRTIRQKLMELWIAETAALG